MSRRGQRRQYGSDRIGPRGAAPAPDLQSLLRAASEHHQRGELGLADGLYRRVLKFAPNHPDVLHWYGVLCHQRDKPGQAVRLLRKAAAAKPGDAAIHYNLAEVLRATGDREAALRHYRRALALAPDQADIHYGLGHLLAELGRGAEALPALSEAERLSPDDSDIANDLGNLLAELGDDAGALAKYRRAVALNPASAKAQFNLGQALEGDGEPERIIAAYHAAVAADPGFAEAQLALAKRLQEADRPGRAVEHARLAVEARPEDPEMLFGLADLLRQNDDWQAAEAVFRRVIELKPDHAPGHNSLGFCLDRLGRIAAAQAHYTKALALDPDYADAHFNLGLSYQNLGRFDQARAKFEDAIRLKPDFSDAHFCLAVMQGPRDAAAETERLAGLLAADGVEDEDRIKLRFALARHYEDQGRLDEAFRHYHAANTAKFESRAFNPDSHRDIIGRTIRAFSADFFGARQGWGSPSTRPIFIVGMPRSGTSLAEQILAAHSRVFGAGELDDIRFAVRDLPATLASARPSPDCVADATPAQILDLAESHLATLEQLGPSAAHVVDKMPGNYLHLGFIALMFPNARIIHCRRDPLDTCVSCYFQNFARGQTFSYDLEALGFVYREYRRVMAHWRQVLPIEVLDLDYEAVIGDQEGETRRLLDFCRLDWEDDCLAFHQQERQVRTASVWQVRQPIYASSVNRWKRFEHHLGPLIASLGAGPDEESLPSS